MEYYDIIIVGAGIAGCGLAYNLKKSGYKGKILIIDKKEPGANAAYGYRGVTKETITKYNLPFEHIFKGIKTGVREKTYFTLNKKYYFVNYKKSCKYLLKKSHTKFKKEIAIKLGRKVLRTHKNKYFFNFLIDCSGNNFFAKKILKQKLPSKYFIGITRILKNKIKDTQNLYYHFTNTCYVEDFYSLKNKTIQGDWQYVKKIDFKRINPPSKNIYKTKIKNPKILKEYQSIIPTAPALPLVYYNIAFLGDSFGNASPSAFGIPFILDSSEILTIAIKKNDLNYYKKIWKRRYLETYIKYLVIKYERYHDTKFLRKFKKNPTQEQLMPYFQKYPDIIEKTYECDPTFNFPSEFINLFSKRSKIIKLYFYLYLKLKYSLMEI